MTSSLGLDFLTVYLNIDFQDDTARNYFLKIEN